MLFSGSSFFRYDFFEIVFQSILVLDFFSRDELRQVVIWSRSKEKNQKKRDKSIKPGH